jgi:hypothetical protein
MKTIFIIVLLAMIAAASFADTNSDRADWETYQLIDRLITLEGPTQPIIHENFVIFTASTRLRKVGVSFAHENFSKVYWYRQLQLPQDQLNAPIPPGKKVPDLYIDSGIQFYVYPIPESIKELEYRLVINGLWTTDPGNSRIRRDAVSGLSLSVLPVPPKISKPDPLKGLPKGLIFTFNGPPGESVTVAGNFNSWDPFMYELKEDPAGVYSANIPLPSGTYHYVFFHRGQRYVDPNNPKRIYSKNGSAASVIEVP